VSGGENDPARGGVSMAQTAEGAGLAGGRLADRAYQVIRARILSGHLQPGTVLAEGEQAASLGMSKTPVRLALRALRQEGLLDAGPRRQLVVRGFSPAHRREILEVREALERIAVARAAADMPDEALDELHVLLRRQQRAVAVEDEARFIELDEAFHLRIAAGAGLHIVPKLLAQLRGFVRVMRLGTVRGRGHLSRVLAEHERLLRALESRSVPDALAALEEHLHTSDYPSD
jgi:DNA-binding GntR family transcriptional regulator